VVDSSSIAVHRRTRRAKSEALDVRKLLSMRMRSQHGERDVWRVVHVPAVEAEDQRHLHRDLATLKQERARTTTRLKGWLRSQGVRLTSVSKLPAQLEALRLWDGAPIPSGLRRRWLRVYAPHTFLREQMAAWEAQRRALGGRLREGRLGTGWRGTTPTARAAPVVVGMIFPAAARLRRKSICEMSARRWSLM
jgi:transposase